MEDMKRFAIYYAPRSSAFADAAARWLGWDLARGRSEVQPDVPGLAALTAVPGKYGFHGTIKPPFRLAEKLSLADLAQAVEALAKTIAPVRLPGLDLVQIDGFLALIPAPDPALSALADKVVQSLDPFRAALTEAEIARRRPESLSPRQRDLLAQFGYPYVMEDFKFHLTLTDRLAGAEGQRLKVAAARHFAGLIPEPFWLEDLCLCGEDQGGRFHLIHRYALSD